MAAQAVANCTMPKASSKSVWSKAKDSSISRCRSTTKRSGMMANEMSETRLKAVGHNRPWQELLQCCFYKGPGGQLL